jgi:hypothetical protein
VGRSRVTARVANLLDRHVVDTGFIGALGDERFVPASGIHGSVALSLD